MDSPNAAPQTPDDRDPLAAEVEAFLAETRMSRWEFGKRCMNDTSFCLRLLSGERSCTGRTGKKVRTFMRTERERIAGERAAEAA